MMKVVILAGGRGTRLAEETSVRPKPMIEIGGKPIIWHIMKIYASYGYCDFLVACGYKGEVIKEYFYNYLVHNNDFIVDMKSGARDIVQKKRDDWRIGLFDTGISTNTGGRILRLRQWIGNNPFMVTYGDGVGDVDIQRLVEFHRSHGRLATVTAVHPPARFGGLTLDGDFVSEFSEKSQTVEGWINGGFFVFEPGIFEYLHDDNDILERDPLEQLAMTCQLVAYKHAGFWQPMDTLREKQILEDYWESGLAPWKVWK
jgi:glucose-1-phosphate cytidylyltransferase